MKAVVFEHVPVAELPRKWRDRLAGAGDTLVTVRIEAEEATGRSGQSAQSVPSVQNEPFATDDPAFGIWRDREDMEDVAACVRRLRQSRYRRDGTRNES